MRQSGVCVPSSGAEDLRILGDCGSGGASVEPEGVSPGSGDVGAVFGRSLVGKTRRDTVLEGVFPCRFLAPARAELAGSVVIVGDV